MVCDRKGRVYIGSRTSSRKPNLDTEYIGSFTDPKFIPHRKIILRPCYTQDEALYLEAKLIQFLYLRTRVPLINKAMPSSNKQGYILLHTLKRSSGWMINFPKDVYTLARAVKKLRKDKGGEINKTSYSKAVRDRKHRFGLSTARRISKWSIWNWLVNIFS